MGAWISGLLIAHDPNLDAAVLTTPVARVDEAVERLDFCAGVRHALRHSPLSLARLDLAANIPPSEKKILIHEALYD